MSYVQVRHKVQDYDSWKEVFDNFAKVRKANGELSYQILHPENDPNNVVAWFEWDDSENAKDFMQSPDLQEAMKEAGVKESPEIYFLESVAQGTV
jgi:quinol monooxygenase YgiN